MLKTGLGSAAIRELRRLRESGTVCGLSDGPLLERFLAHGEEAAFEALVVRHGPMVWGVCHRILGDHHDAQDAFQATFLVLARKAASVVPLEMVGPWLHGVACRTALKAKTTKLRRRARERTVAEMPETVAKPSVKDDRLALLDVELERLPRKYRIPIVVCDLEGTTQEEAARRLGCPVGTLSGRLWRARAMLAKRMTRRGLTLSSGSLALLLAQGTVAASAPTALVIASVNGALNAAAGRVLAPALVSTEVVPLAEGVIKAMRFAHWKSAMVLLTLGLFGSGIALMAQHPGAGNARAEDKATAVRQGPGTDARAIRRGKQAGPILVGRVVDKAGQPLAGARIVLHGGFATRTRGEEMTTGADGRYRFDPLKTGGMIKDKEADRWDLSVGIQVFHPTHVSEDGLSWWDVRVPGIDGQETVKDFTMVPGGRLDGRVVDAGTGAPVPGLDLRVQSPSARSVKFGLYATTDKDGRFTLTALFPAEYVVDVNSPQLRYPVLAKVKIQAKETATVNFPMKVGLETWLAKIIDGHGGARTLGSIKAFTETIRETPSGGKATTTKHFIQLPDKYRSEIRHPGDDKTEISIVTPERMRGWNKHPDGKVEELPSFALDEQAFKYWLDVLKFFGPRAAVRVNDTEHKRTLVGDSKIGDRPVVSIRVEKSVRLFAVLEMYFDKETGLLLRQRDDISATETDFKDYQDFAGVPVARRWTIRGPKSSKGVTTEGEVVEFKAVDKFDPALFVGP